MNLIRSIEALKQGKPIILVDDESRENEGDLICAAEFATAEMINFFISKARGLVCLTLEEYNAERLGLRPMVSLNNSKMGTAFTESIEARHGISTGISPKDRALTIAKAVCDSSNSQDFVRPGHVFPLVAKPLGVLERQGQTEGSVDLCKLAGLKPMAVICEIINEDGTMARLPDLEIFAKEFDLPIISVEEIRRYRLENELFVKPSGKAKLPTKKGDFLVEAFLDPVTNSEHLALSYGNLDMDQPLLVRVQSSCMTSEIFGSLRCECRNQLDKSMDLIKQNGSGIVVYLNQEGRGIGIFEKIKSYQLQDQGLNTREANLHLGHGEDERDYYVAIQILKFYKAKKISLLTNNPRKIKSLKRHFEVTRSSLVMKNLSVEASAYLNSKFETLGHMRDA